MLLPTRATFRLSRAAASMICCLRWTWLAKQATTTRRWAASKISVRVLPTSTSEGMKPARSALVESASSRARPSPGSRARPPGWGGGAAVDGGEVQLEVAGVHDGAVRGPQGQRDPVGDGVRDGVELQVERAEGGAVPGGGLDQGRDEPARLEH